MWVWKPENVCDYIIVFPPVVLSISWGLLFSFMNDIFFNEGRVILAHDWVENGRTKGGKFQ